MDDVKYEVLQEFAELLEIFFYGSTAGFVAGFIAWGVGFAVAAIIKVSKKGTR